MVGRLGLAALACGLGLTWSAPAAAQSDGLTDLDREVQQVLTGRGEAGPLVIHFEPGATTDAELEDDVAANLAAWVELQQQLDMPGPRPAHVFLYRDAARLKALTGVDTIAFGTGERSVHQVHDFRGTHEFVHLFALDFPCDGEAFSDGFIVEGLATGLTPDESGAPLHDWCAVYGRLGRLPELWAFRGTFPEGAPDGVHPYHVAGSFVRWLVERFGLAAVQGYYVNASEAQASLGVSFAQLERDWWAMLQARRVVPAVEARILRRLEPERARWEQAGPRPARPLDLGMLVSGASMPAGSWRATSAGLTGLGADDGEWTALALPDPVGAPGLAARFRLPQGGAFRLAFTDAGGDPSEPLLEAIFTPGATYLTSGEGYAVAHDLSIAPGWWNEVVLDTLDGRSALFLHGLLLLEAPLPAGLAGPSAGPRRSAIAVQGGRVEVSRLEFRAR